MSIPVPEYMKIRQYVVNLVANANGHAVKIMSERALCKKFDVARGTARKALEDLIKEGYLVPRRGMGTFVSPRKTASSRVSMSRKVGVIMSSGMLVNITEDYQQQLTGIFAALAGHDVAVQFVNFAARGAHDTFQDVEALGFDGLIWLHPPVYHPEIVDYFAARMDALVTVAPLVRPAWKHAVLDDYQGAMLKGVEKLIAQAGADVVFVGRNDQHPEVRELYAAFEALFAARGLQRPPRYTIAADNITKPLQALLRAHKPQAVYSQGGEFGQATMEVLRREAQSLPVGFQFLCQDAPELATLSANIRVVRIPRPDHRRLGRAAAKMLINLMMDTRPGDARPATARVMKVARTSFGTSA